MNTVFCQIFHLYIPLLFNQRLYCRMASLMCSYIMSMLFDLNKISLFFQIFHNCSTSFIAFHTCILSAKFVDRSIIIHNINFRKIVTSSYFKVIRIMCRCNLNRTCSKLFINVSICNNRNFLIYKRKQYHLSYNILVTLVIRMNCNSSISKHSLRACCCDLKEAVRSYDRIFNVPEMSRLFLMFYFSI